MLMFKRKHVTNCQTREAVCSTTHFRNGHKYFKWWT